MRWLPLLLMVLLLTGCGSAPAQMRIWHIPPAETTVSITESLPETTPEATAPEKEPVFPVPESVSPTQPTAPEQTTPPEPGREETRPEPTVPSRQPGDTTDTWDPARASDFPEDQDCTPEELLEKYIALEGLDLRDFPCGQLVLVVAHGNEARIHCYALSRSGWEPVEGLTDLAGHVGKNGIRHDRRRNSLTSPAGLWSLELAFGNSPKPQGLRLPWRDVTPCSDWVCDDTSHLFNTWQERQDEDTDPWDWDETEHLENYPSSYAYACTTGFNMAPYTVPNRGCAIFFHCGQGPTEGCVSLPEGEFLQVLVWLDPAKAPYILISGTEG